METTTLQRPSTDDEFEITPNGIWTEPETTFETHIDFFRRYAETV